MQKKRLKIIPDRVFHKLWVNAGNYSSDEEYINCTVSDSKMFNFKGHGLDYPEYADMLKKIYRLRHYKLKDISGITSKKKSELSHIFCIPIRTIEAWYSDINVIPPYILLMMLKHFHLLELGKYVRLESEIEHENSKPAVYARKNASGGDESEPVEAKKSAYEEFMESEDYDAYLDKLIASAKNRRNGV